MDFCPCIPIELGRGWTQHDAEEIDNALTVWTEWRPARTLSMPGSRESVAHGWPVPEMVREEGRLLADIWW